MGAPSILDDLGEEVTGIVAPVSICMALTVALVRLLNPDGDSSSSSVSIATAYYNEDEGDSTSQKLEGSVINALIFVGIVGLMTFILVLLFKYGYTRVIYAYMGFSGFSIFFLLTGVIAVRLLQEAGAHLDWISFSYMLWNFAAVGSATMFTFPAPLLMKQAYLVVVGVVTAYVFTWIPEWTTWVLLLAMAAYDVVAVLVPGGPLRALVELAQEREEDIPALVYQARPSGRRAGRAAGEQQQPAAAAAATAEMVQQDARRGPPLEPLQRDSAGSVAASSSSSKVAAEGGGVDEPLMAPRAGVPRTRSDDPAAPAAGGSAKPSAAVAVDAVPHPLPPPPPPQQQQQQQPASPLRRAPPADAEFELPEAIKLGLGDFIFYSVLVGRAAMYDWVTVFACYLAIVAGLGVTLLWLAVSHHALPALPVSIALAVAFYFISRFVMEPVILPMTLLLAYF